MPIVSDSSPLIVLAKIEQLDLLVRLFAEVLIPEEVWDEIDVAGGSRPDVRAIAEASWMRRVTAPAASSGPLPRRLGRGETAAIRLATEHDPLLVVLLDDSDARLAAERIGLTCTGTVGVLVRAKQASLVPAVGPLLVQVRSAELYLSDSLVASALRSVGESSL